MLTHANLPSRRMVLGLLAASCMVPHATLADPLQAVEGRAFGTHWQLLGTNGNDIEGLRPAFEAVFARVDQQFSPYRADSAISRINATGASPIKAPPDLLRVAKAGLDISRRSEGAFDPTVGPLVAQLGFGPILEGGPRDWRGLSVGATALTKARADLTVDLCGIAKGWALDKAVALLRAAGQTEALLDLGGELCAIGQHPHGRDWQVAVEAPMLGLSAPYALRLPSGLAVATSGTRVQSYLLNETLHSHIVGLGDRVGDAPRSVTVVAEDAMSADGWATALCAAGPVMGPEIARREGLAALFLTAGPEGLTSNRTRAVSEFLL